MHKWRHGLNKVIYNPMYFSCLNQNLYKVRKLYYRLGSDFLVSVTSIYDKFQTVIPAEIRKEFNLDKSYKIEWTIKDNGKVELNFIKELSLDDMVGRYSAVENIDSVKLKHDFKNNKL